MYTNSPTLISEQDAVLILGSSEEFLVSAVKLGRVECVHLEGKHFFTLGSILGVKREMVAKSQEFFADERDVVSASRLEPSYF